MGNLEVIAAILGVINVALVVRRSIWNFPVAMVTVSLYAVIFFNARLYSNAMLQIFFFVLNIYGWWYWARCKAEMGEIRVEVMDLWKRLVTPVGIAIMVLLWGWLMSTQTDADFAWWDATIAMMSVAAQILLSRRYIENWILWIAVDVLAVGLYWVKELPTTSALYVALLALSIWGQEEWLRALRGKRLKATA
ncbi:nicotinamide riboside transporter PnuC [Sphingomonas sp. LaA6.9]|uniref:nicotinamide riboside transporter PnuC n=1 Tax=Sphingomonas sp. LaA6.9 TaxID=2919914 RepID=UPI001F4F6615|nr:nicotinamide riboside transporter PnuC [Sphingomonas sp. LaA6.9]MCJ8158472.1 nicotinamide riboside transporter PnuC [Sphingomonas sp. LaA6.9]